MLESIPEGSPMLLAIYSVVLAIVVIVLYLFLVEFRLQYARLHGRRIVTCPENCESAGVDINSDQAAFSAALTGTPTIRLRDCSRWPEHAECDQICLREVRRSPDDTLMRTTLFRWYSDRPCRACGTRFEEIDWINEPPALITLDDRHLTWGEVPPETLRMVLSTAHPVCWRCHRDALPRERVANVLA